MYPADEIYHAFKKWYGDHPVNRRLVCEEAFRAGAAFGWESAIIAAKEGGWPDNLIDALRRKRDGRPDRKPRPLTDDGRRPEGRL